MPGTRTPTRYKPVRTSEKFIRSVHCTAACDWRPGADLTNDVKQHVGDTGHSVVGRAGHPGPVRGDGEEGEHVTLRSNVMESSVVVEVTDFDVRKLALEYAISTRTIQVSGEKPTLVDLAREFEGYLRGEPLRSEQGEAPMASLTHGDLCPDCGNSPVEAADDEPDALRCTVCGFIRHPPMGEH